MTTLERAAQALAALQGAKWDARSVMETPGGEEPEEMREGFRDQARAVLLAVRADPGGPARAAYFATCNRHGFRAHINASCAMETMIDAILSEEA